MVKTFLPKNTVLSQKDIDNLKKDFKLSEENIFEMQHWNNPHSPYTGVIIGDPNSNFPCYPYDRPDKEFMEEFPDGAIWKPE
jgi:hypothetical protein